MKILGIETSCDETAAAVVDDLNVLSSVINSQVDLHRQYGGVVPELASRSHIEAVVPVVREALETAGVGLNDLDGLAVTRGPGLVGALLVGVNLAKAMSWATGLPLAGVNHLQAHVAAGFLANNTAFPLAAMVVSGGHTNLYLVRAPLEFELRGRTRDDAAGEAYDKVAKLLGLGYPGGRVIDELAGKGDPTRFVLPRPMLGRGLDFSFSGLKTAVVNLVAEQFGAEPVQGRDLHDLAAGFQDAVVDVLTKKAEALLTETNTKRFVLAGGVAANSALRQAMTEMTDRLGVDLLLPSVDLCTDNAAMVAVMGQFHLQAGQEMSLEDDALARWP
jgi:N6-L-threonylcarbamoyladenine synthase